MAVFANTGFIGLPVMKALYGSEGFLYGIIYYMAYQEVLFTLGVMLLGGSRKFRWRALYGDPVTVLSVAALLIYLSPFRFPALLDGLFNQIGDMCVPISMIVTGCCVADVKFRDILREKSAYLISLLRLLALPLAMLAVLAALKLDPVLTAACVVLTGLPVGSLNVILAQRYGADTGFATTAVVQCLLLVLAALPLTSLEKHLFGRSKRNVLTAGAASCYLFTAFELCDDKGILRGTNKINNSLVIADIFYA